ncbi:hypothetical protein [Vibrio bivalvicida]|uniref:Uncharacterized protein n=1 Tax=Vibrio bivalvicida TaxID=1276888 RepID=A0A177XX06_9VIBR|nr:hypothetical protein [Vibrio bivalvicida]OAJ93109.1 hypothetical protein APB76_16550 [Vibrio bivalvicida]
MRSLLLGLALVASQPVQALDIFNIKSGDLCENTEGKRWVCHDNVDTYVTGQSRCMYNQNVEPCTWYGFEFEYKSYDEKTPLRCSLLSSYPMEFGNPKDLEGKSDTQNFEFMLESSEGVFFNPQYMLLPRYGEAVVVEHRVECKYNEETVFESLKRFHFPKI